MTDRLAGEITNRRGREDMLSLSYQAAQNHSRLYATAVSRRLPTARKTSTGTFISAVTLSATLSTSRPRDFNMIRSLETLFCDAKNLIHILAVAQWSACRREVDGASALFRTWRLAYAHPENPVDPVE